MSTKIFFTGATGYIGSTVLNRLLGHPESSEFDITILLRTPEKAKAFGSYGLKVLVGTMADPEFLERTAAQFDIIIQTANDQPDAINPILRGLKNRFEQTSKKPKFIHTSGTGILMDNALGKCASNEIWSDLDVAKIDAIPLTGAHRATDIAIIEASKQGYVETYIVYPSTVWGRTNHDFAQKKLSNISSTQVPALTGGSLMRSGKTPCVGEAKNMWSHVHIDETADFYYILFDAIISGKTPANGSEGHYFLESGEYVMYDVAKAIAMALHAAGKSEIDEPIALSEKELAGIRSAWKFGTNARAKGDRSRSLGWQPTKTTEEMLADIPSEVQVFLETQTETWKAPSSELK